MVATHRLYAKKSGGIFSKDYFRRKTAGGLNEGITLPQLAETFCEGSRIPLVKDQNGSRLH